MERQRKGYWGVFLLGFCLGGGPGLGLAAPAFADPTGAWQVPAEVTEVTDGDTVKVLARPYPDLLRSDKIRLLDLDTPEIFHPRCPEEAEAGQTARRRAVELLQDKNVVLVSDGKRDGFGRLLAHLRLADGRDYAAVMIREQLGLSKKPESWCLLLDRHGLPSG